MSLPSVKFSREADLNFHKTLQSRVKEYFESNNISKQGNLELYFKTLVMFVMLLTPYFLMIFGVVNSLGGAFACWIIMGVGTAGMGMSVMHDANHLSYSKKQSQKLLPEVLLSTVWVFCIGSRKAKVPNRL